MEYKDTIDIDDLILHKSVDHNLDVSEHGLFFYTLKSKLPVMISTVEWRTTKIKGLVKWIAGKNWLGRKKFNLIAKW